MNVVIIEDEYLAAQKLSRILKDIEPDIQISATIPSVASAVAFFEHGSNAELIFMDIQLEDGVCFDIFDATNIEAPVIFTTAYDEYTLKAFKQNSIDYLLKPIKRDELGNAINKYRKNHQKISISTLQRAINTFRTEGYKERFLVKIGDHYKSIETKLITCFYVKGGYAFINTTDKRSYGIDYSLDKIEYIVNPKCFFRVNRNYIVRFDSIDNILAYSSNRLKIRIKDFIETEAVIVSRERVKAFKEWMDR